MTEPTNTLHRNKAQLRTNELETRQLDGKDYLVAPTVVLVEGVLNGIYTPAEEIGDFYESWNGRPLPLRHPQQDGVYLSANSPATVESQVLGYFWNAAFDGKRLKGEMWLDVEKIARLGDDALTTLQRIQAGEPVEVSTAYWSEDEEAQGTFEGKPYLRIARNLRPDHIAILPDEEGACNWADGCGVPRVNKENVMPVTANEIELSDKLALVRAQFWRNFRPEDESEYWDYDIIGIFENSVIAKDWANKRHIAVDYTVAESGDAVAFGEPVEVQVVYRAAESGTEVVINQEIEPMPEEQKDVQTNTQPEETPCAGKSEQSQTQQSKAEPVANNEQPQSDLVEEVEHELDEELKDVAALLKELGGADGIRESLQMLKSNRDEVRQNLIAELTANSLCAFEAAELNAMETTTLQKLAQSLRLPNYAGRGGPRANRADDGEWENYADPYSQ